MTTGHPSRGTRAAVVLLLLCTAIVTILRAVRLPNDFAEAHWLLDYRFGFIRRGLLGEIVRRIANLAGATLTEQVIAALAAIVFALLWLALGACVVRWLGRSRWRPDAVLAALAFLSSPFVVMNAHFMGYLDHPVLLLTLTAIWLLARGHVVAATVLQAGAIFVHESAIVVGFPAWTLALWLTVHRTGAPHWRRMWPILLPVAAFIIVAAADRAQHQADVRERLSRRLARAEFVGGDMHLLVPEWLSESFSENYVVHSRHFESRLTSAPMYGLVLPTVLAALCVMAERYRPRPLDALLTIGAVIAPLVLHLAAFDTARIWTFTIAAAFIALWIHSELRPVRSNGSATACLVAAAAVVSNVMVTSPLMDGLSERFGLAARLSMYAPTLAFVAYLLWSERRRLSVRPDLPPPSQGVPDPGDAGHGR